MATLAHPQGLGRRIKSLRALRGWSQQQLADRAGVSRVYVSDLEQGKRSRPGYQPLARLAFALQVPTAELVDGGPVAELAASADGRDQLRALIRDEVRAELARMLGLQPYAGAAGGPERGPGGAAPPVGRLPRGPDSNAPNGIVVPNGAAALLVGG